MHQTVKHPLSLEVSKGIPLKAYQVNNLLEVFPRLVGRVKLKFLALFYGIELINIVKCK